MMEGIVNDGTSSAGQVRNILCWKNIYIYYRDRRGSRNARFVILLLCPSYNPQIAVLVVLNKPEDKTVGSSAAAAVALKSLKYINLYGCRAVFTEAVTTIW